MFTKHTCKLPVRTGKPLCRPSEYGGERKTMMQQRCWPLKSLQDRTSVEDSVEFDGLFTQLHVHL